MRRGSNTNAHSPVAIRSAPNFQTTTTTPSRATPPHQQYHLLQQQLQQLQQQQHHQSISSSSYFEEWLQVDKRRREICYSLTNMIQLLMSHLPFKRQHGLNQLIQFLNQMLGQQQQQLQQTNSSFSSGNRNSGNTNNPTIQQQQNDVELFHLIHGTACEDTNVIVAVCKYILRKQPYLSSSSSNHANNNDHGNNNNSNNSNNSNTPTTRTNSLLMMSAGDDGDAGSLSIENDQVRYHLNTRESRISEIKQGLTVLEGCFLLSSKCSATLAAINGFKLILNILSEGPMYINDAKYLHFKHAAHNISNNNNNGSSGSNNNNSNSSRSRSANGGGSSQSNGVGLDKHMEEIQLLALDTLEAALHNSFSNIVLFCAESGPDVIVTMLWNSALAQSVRIKCIEFIIFLIKWAQETDEQAGIAPAESLHDCNSEESTAGSVMNRIQVFLGAKLASDFIDLYQKVSSKKDGVLDQHAIEQFIKRMDQRS